MKNKNLYAFLGIFLIFLLVIIPVFISKSNKKIKNLTSYEAKKNSSSKNVINEKNNNLEKTINKAEEKEISSFSTKIFNNDEARQNNIKITSSKLNNYIIKNGETFSFCNILGPSTSKDGYKEADIFDNNGKKKKGLGGGNCQVSTTLYNALLSISNIEIIEKHTHSNYVPYIEKGKDAAVAFGSFDLKFKNNTGKDLKLFFDVTNHNVTVKIFEIS